MKFKVKKKKQADALGLRILKGETDFSETEVLVDARTEKAIANLNAAMDQLSTVLVERDTEIAALKLCLVTREHLMLEGPAGVAKSMLANEAFSRIIGGRNYSKQLTSTTQPDEVLGCMDTKTYREKAVWEFNVKGMFPDCHFAFLDEVYRAAKSFLSNLMQIMNERTFYNGPKILHCPLMTTIGTTNFTVIDDELDAFHDRWLVKVKVQRLSSIDARLAAMDTFLSRQQGKNKFDSLSTVSLNELVLVQNFARQVPIPFQILEVYEELVRTFISRSKDITISDRRMNQTLKLIQANYLLGENRGESVSEGVLSAAQYGLVTVGNAEQSGLFAEVYEKVIGERIKDQELARKMHKILKAIKTMEADYDDAMPVGDAKQLYRKSIRILSAFNTLEQEQTMPVKGKARDYHQEGKGKLQSLVASLKPLMEKAIAKEVEEELDELD